MSHTPFQFQTESKQKYIRDQSNQNNFQNFRNKIKMEARFNKFKNKGKGKWEIIPTRHVDRLVTSDRVVDKPLDPDALVTNEVRLQVVLEVEGMPKGIETIPGHCLAEVGVCQPTSLLHPLIIVSARQAQNPNHDGEFNKSFYTSCQISCVYL